MCLGREENPINRRGIPWIRDHGRTQLGDARGMFDFECGKPGTGAELELVPVEIGKIGRNRTPNRTNSHYSDFATGHLRDSSRVRLFRNWFTFDLDVDPFNCSRAVTYLT
jgi:hypothetical protein